MTTRIALAHVLVAVVLSLGSFVAPRLFSMTEQRAVEFAIYGGAVALLFQLVAVGIAAYAKARPVMWAAIGGTVLAVALTFVALARMI